MQVRLIQTPEAQACACLAHLVAGLHALGPGLTNAALHRSGVVLRRLRKVLPCTPDSVLLELHQLRALRHTQDWTAQEHRCQSLAHLQAWQRAGSTKLQEALVTLVDCLAQQLGRTWLQEQYLREFRATLMAQSPAGTSEPAWHAAA